MLSGAGVSRRKFAEGVLRAQSIRLAKCRHSVEHHSCAPYLGQTTPQRLPPKHGHFKKEEWGKTKKRSGYRELQ